MRHVSEIPATFEKPGRGPQSYSEQLRDERWQNRSAMFRHKNNYCHSCRQSAIPLTVHHVNYKLGCKLWEAHDADLVTLCQPCHDLIGEVSRAFRRTAAFCTASNAAKMQLILEALIRRDGETRTLLKLSQL